MIFIQSSIVQNINSQFYVELFVEHYLRCFRKYLICVQIILQTDKSAIIRMIFGLNKNTVQYIKYSNSQYKLGWSMRFEVLTVVLPLGYDSITG